jgi:hypothetical protein
MIPAGKVLYVPASTYFGSEMPMCWQLYVLNCCRSSRLPGSRVLVDRFHAAFGAMVIPKARGVAR